MTGVTSDPNDPRLARGPDDEPRDQADVYLVLSDEERAKGFVRPLRSIYKHLACEHPTTMGPAIAETYARDPNFYGGTYCCHCRMHKPVGPLAPLFGGEPGGRGEFVWLDGSYVGS